MVTGTATDGVLAAAERSEGVLVLGVAPVEMDCGKSVGASELTADGSPSR